MNSYGIYPNARPPGWELHDLVQPEIENLTSTLKSRGIDQTLLAFEIEFLCNEDPLKGNEKWIELREEILSELHRRAELFGVTTPEGSELLKKAEQASQFTAREVLMFDLIDRDERTRELLLPLFGQQRDGTGYYDAEGILELKFQPLPVEDAVEGHHKLLSVLFEKATELGLVIDSGKIGHHLNVSFWREGQNLLEGDHPEYATTGALIVSGIAQAVFDSGPFVLPAYYLNKELKSSLAVTVDRENMLRIANGRIELRLDGPPTQVDPDTVIPIVLAGAAFGLRDQHQHQLPSSLKPPVLQERPNVRANEAHKVVCHFLDNSLVDAKGNLSFPNHYFAAKEWDLAHQLRLIPDMPNPDLAMWTVLVFRNEMKEFFQNVTVDRTSSPPTLVWPSNTEDGTTYSLRVPEKSLDKISSEFRELLESGKSVEEISKMSPAFAQELEDLVIRAIPRPRVSEILPIDLAPLREQIAIERLTPVLTIPDGYDWDELPDGCRTLRSARTKRLKESAVLNGELSNRFHSRMAKVAQNFFPQN
jgi:hypothetical protein